MLSKFKLLSKNLIKPYFCYSFSHTDIKVPDFSKYRRGSGVNPDESLTLESRDEEKIPSNAVLALTLITSCYAAKSISHYFIKSMSMTADVQALARIEVNLTEIEVGGHLTVKWRNKPLFLKHRKQDEIQNCKETPLSILRDPATDEDRCPNPEWLVIIGVCTHLGCVPIPNSGDYLGGYYCPCHGSHYDAAGRIRKGPAPTNMEIPEHKFVSDDLLIVG